MGETSNHQIPFAEPNDPIDGHPAADKLQAEKIDGIVPPKGGQAGEALVKTANADYHYDWQPVGGGGGPTPDPDLGNLGDLISGESDNQLGLSDNGGTQDPPLLYVPPTVIPPVYEVLGDATEPEHFVGKGRPDVDTGVHSAEEIAQLAAAPQGSTYICVDANDDDGKNFGAAVWRKGATDWVCVEGDTPRANLLPDFGDTIETCYGYRSGSTVHIQSAKATGPNSTLAPFYDWAQPIFTSASIWGVTCDTTYPYEVDNIAAWVVGPGGIRAGNNTPAGKWNNMYPYSYETRGPWPTAITAPSNAWLVEHLKARVEEIENDPDHPQHDNLAELKAELEALYNDVATGDL